MRSAKTYRCTGATCRISGDFGDYRATGAIDQHTANLAIAWWTVIGSPIFTDIRRSAPRDAATTGAETLPEGRPAA